MGSAVASVVVLGSGGASGSPGAVASTSAAGSPGTVASTGAAAAGRSRVDGCNRVAIEPEPLPADPGAHRRQPAVRPAQASAGEDDRQRGAPRRLAPVPQAEADGRQGQRGHHDARRSPFGERAADDGRQDQRGGGRVVGQRRSKGGRRATTAHHGDVGHHRRHGERAGEVGPGAGAAPDGGGDRRLDQIDGQRGGARFPAQRAGHVRGARFVVAALRDVAAAHQAAHQATAGYAAERKRRRQPDQGDARCPRPTHSGRPPRGWGGGGRGCPGSPARRRRNAVCRRRRSPARRRGNAVCRRRRGIVGGLLGAPLRTRNARPPTATGMSQVATRHRMRLGTRIVSAVAGPMSAR